MPTNSKNLTSKITNIFKGDKVIWMVFFFLCLISITEVYSASSSLSYRGKLLESCSETCRHTHHRIIFHGGNPQYTLQIL